MVIVFACAMVTFLATNGFWPSVPLPVRFITAVLFGCFQACFKARVAGGSVMSLLCLRRMFRGIFVYPRGHGSELVHISLKNIVFQKFQYLRVLDTRALRADTLLFWFLMNGTVYVGLV